MNQRRLLLVGWDSADWKIIEPLVAAGKMPVLAHLMQAGVAGNLTTIEPQLSPMLWTSIATGKHAYRHGVPGFTEVNEAGQVVPVSAATRQCKALWDILGERGLKSHVVGWFATQGEQPEGCLVSNLYHSWPHQKDDAPEDWPPPPPGTYWPEDLGRHLNESRVSPWDIDPDEVIKLLVPDADQVDQSKDHRLWFITKRLSEAFSVHAASCWLLENRPDWNLFAVYFRAIDEICHRFMPYHPPQMDGVPDDDFLRYQHVVEGAYRLHDLMLARLINLAGTETAVVLVSDHGFHSDHLRPRFTPRVPAGITVWHRPQGIFCAMGPGFRTGETIFGARLLDVAPTLLTWFGLPVGEDMDGRTLLDAFSNGGQPKTLPSWETTGVERRMARPLSAADNRQLLDQFVELGYIDPVSAESNEAAIETNRENDWNMARASMDGGRYEEALPLLESIIQQQPHRNDYAQMLAICQLRLGLFAEAEATVKASVRTLGGKSTGVLLMQANIALEAGDSKRAMTLLDEAESFGGESPTASQWELIARVHLALRQWNRCAEASRKVLALDPENPQALLILARCSLHENQPEQAAEYALAAIGVQYGNPEGHLLLGVALAIGGQWAAAAKAYNSVIRLSPKHALAHRLLANTLEKTGEVDAAQRARLQAWQLRDSNQNEVEAKLKTLREESAARAVELRQLLARRQAEKEARESAAQSEGLPQDTEFVIVSGLPRSGTSLMMQMLQAGGLAPMTDEKRKADEDNPRGYFEWEHIRQLPKNPLLIEQADGKAVKVVAPLLGALPGKHRYKVIFMKRPVAEVVSSQLTMLKHRGTAQRATTEHLQKLQEDQVEECLQFLRKHSKIDLLEIEYPDLIADPARWAETLGRFLGPKVLPQPGAMVAMIDPALYRQRLCG